MKTLPKGSKAALRSSIAATLVLASTQLANADDSLFGYVTGAETTVKGEVEVVQWITGRFGKQTGSYTAADLNTEIEYGITDRLQTAIYFNNVYHRAKGANAGAVNYPAINDRHSFDYSGTALEFKYMALSPYTNPVGLSFYFEPGWSRREKVDGDHNTELELEFKIILEKRFLDDSVVTTLNLIAEPEWERDAGARSYDGELELGASLGAAYRFAPGWHAGVEARLDSKADNMDINQIERVTLFAGPTIHYTRNHWWATLTAFPQVAGWPSDKGTGGLELKKHETLEVRLKTGVEF